MPDRSLLAVLTPYEAEHFLPAPLLAELRALFPGFSLLDPTGLSPAAFAEKLAAADPTILLACWKTPLLPAVLPARLRYVCYLTGSIKTLVTRAGPGTKIICLGNIAQIDTPYLTEGSSGLTYVVDRFKGWSHSGHVTLARGERSRLADHASEVL